MSHLRQDEFIQHGIHIFEPEGMGPMQPIDKLMAEHRLIERVLCSADQMIVCLEAGAPLQPDLIEKIIDFCSTYADDYHHGNEEQVLIPACEAHGMHDYSSPIGLVVQEHKMGRHRIRKAKEVLPAALQGDEAARTELIKLLKLYIKLIHCHIGLEDRVFFRQAQQFITREQVAEMAEQLKERARAGGHDDIDAHYTKVADEIEQAVAAMV